MTIRTCQAYVVEWVKSVFGETVAADKKERTLRFVEEAVELAQAVGLEVHVVHRLVDYVFSREKGVPPQEVAGCLVTLFAAAAANGIDVQEQFAIELDRIRQPEVIERCRRRQNEKREALVAVDTYTERVSEPKSRGWA
jgi:hypothetical protein